MYKLFLLITVLLLNSLYGYYIRPVCGGKQTKDECLLTKLDACSNTCCWIQPEKNATFSCEDVIRATSGYLKKQIEDAGGSIECSGKFPICGIAVIVLMLISIR